MRKPEERLTCVDEVGVDVQPGRADASRAAVGVGEDGVLLHVATHLRRPSSAAARERKVEKIMLNSAFFWQNAP